MPTGGACGHALCLNATVSLCVLNDVTAVGTAFVVWGLVTLEVWPTFLGSVLVYYGKLWFLDRMVWLYEDVIAHNEHYRSWLDGH